MAIQLMSLILYPAGLLQMLSYRLIGVKAVYHGAMPGPGVFRQGVSGSFFTLLMVGLKFLLDR
jgi:hypothetical protein